MIDRLKTQQNKLLANERHDAWENVARKIAHEIKNPLTPIQLIIDSLKNKYTDLLDKNNKISFNEKVNTINKQVKLIEKLVNEFSDFARMPKPIFKDNDLVKILNENVKLLSEIDTEISLNINKNNENIFLNCDKEQIGRVFFNLIKNSIESIHQRSEKELDFKKKISIEIIKDNNHIKITIIDNGVGLTNIKGNIKQILNPYYTTKKNGTGLGLSIVNKIINDHNGKLNFFSISNGTKVEVIF
jgi:two-component system nitrogen regulation sensor histidine kinase NtrY